MAVVELRIIWPFLLRRLRLGISDWCRMNRRVSRRAESISSAESGFFEQPADGAGGGERLDVLCDAGKIGVDGIDGALGDHFLMGDELLFEDVLGVMVAEPRHDPDGQDYGEQDGSEQRKTFWHVVGVTFADGGARER